MAIGYRSFLNVRAGESVIDTVVRHVCEWSKAKEIDVAAESPGYHVRDQNDVISILREENEHGSIYRWRRQHPYAHGPREMWRTTLTAVQYPDRSGWVWTEVEVPHDGERDSGSTSNFMSVPGFMRTLLRDLACFDGRTPAAAEPRWVTRAHLPDLMDYLTDDSRRGPVLIASQVTKAADELEEWAHVATWELVGLGTMFLLHRAVEREFNEMVGFHHAVLPGTVRTYAGSINLDDPEDPKRHRTLSRERIDHDPPGRITHILGISQRDRALRVPIPRDAQQINALLTETERVMREGAGYGDIEVTVAVNGDAAGTVPRARRTASSSRSSANGRRAPKEVATVVAELREENLRLRQQVEALTAIVQSYQRCEETIQSTLHTLGEEMKILQGRRGTPPGAGRGSTSGRGTATGRVAATNGRPVNGSRPAASARGRPR